MIGRGRLAFTMAMVALALSAVATAQTTAPSAVGGANTIIEIKAEGNRTLKSAAVLAYVRIRTGDAYEETLVKADERRMLQSGYFESVTATRVVTKEGGVIVTFVVVERPKIDKVVFLGNKAFKDGPLLSELPFSIAGPLNRFSVETGRVALVNKYHNAGYYFAEVTIEEESLAQRRVVYRIVEGPKVAIGKIKFQGNHRFNWLKLRFTIGSQERFWPFIDGVLDNEQVERDIATIRNLYVDDGYLDARVDKTLEFSSDKTRLTLVFVIEEGPRYRVNNVEFKGNVVYSSAELLRRVQMRQGSYFTSLGLRRDTKALEDTYGELGFINAKVEVRRQFMAPDAPVPDWAKHQGTPALLNLVYTITEDDQYAIGRIDIRGNTTTQSRVIRREMRFFPEQLFDTVAVEESRNRLLETRLFEDVTITPVGKTAGVRDALMQVKEGKTAEFIVGVGVSSDSGLLGNISFTQRNFDIGAWPGANRRFWRGEAFKGAGQTLSIVAQPGTELTRFSVDWTEPYLFDKPYILNNRVFFFDRARETYTETRVGDVISLGKRLPNKWYAEVAQRIEGVEIHNLDDDAPPEVRDVEGMNFLAGTRGTLVRDRTDSRWMPSNGDRFSISYEQVYGDFTFGHVDADYHIYRTVYQDALDRKHILAGHVGAGDIVGDAPVFERYYGGGMGSVRGFKYRGISPRSAGTDQQIGGQFQFLAGSEYTYPLIADALRGAVFLDSGTVEKDIGVTTYRASVGVGLRLIIPMFGPVPMSLDLGFPISKSDEDDTQILSFSIGWQF